MCRFLCYKGPPILLSELLYRPRHSLILQSYKATERVEPLNGDGFGIGWYVQEVSTIPCVFTSVTPAWSNKNLKNLAEHIRSECFFAHIRAASPGMAVSEANCHPFRYGTYLWMHNGGIAGFNRIRRKLRESLPDSLYEAIEGTTDSEHAFAVFLKMLGDTEKQASLREMANALILTIRELEAFVTEAQTSEASFYNFAVTDGLNVAAVRYVSDPALEPASLYCGSFNNFEGSYLGTEKRAVILASERLTEPKSNWKRVAPNHVLTISNQLEINVELVPIVRR